MKNLFGKNNPNWRGGKINVKCDECGKYSFKKQFLIKRSKKHYCSTRCRMKNQPKIGGAKNSKNHNWKGDKVGVASLHHWIKLRIPKPNNCKICKIKPPLDLANISNKYNKKTYTRELKNWEWLCRRCHMKKDGRLKIFISNRLKNYV